MTDLDHTPTPEERAHALTPADREFAQTLASNLFKELDEYIRPPLDYHLAPTFASYVKQYEAALIASEKRREELEATLHDIASYPKTHSPDETEGYSLIGTRDQIIERAREVLEG